MRRAKFIEAFFVPQSKDGFLKQHLSSVYLPFDCGTDKRRPPLRTVSWKIQS